MIPGRILRSPGTDDAPTQAVIQNGQKVRPDRTWAPTGGRTTERESRARAYSGTSGGTSASTKTRSQVSDAKQAFAGRNTRLARDLVRQDNEINQRIGDNTVDIAEQTVCVVTGLFREFTDASQPA